MNEENNFDPTLEIGISGVGLNEQETAEAVQNIQAADIENGINQNLEEEKEVVAQEANTIEPKEGLTAGDYVKDTGVGLVVGGRKAASNIITAPERVIDFFSGEMEEEMASEEGYQTEWDQFMYGDGDPLTTKTWWGGVVSAVTEVGGTIAATGGAGRAIGIGTKAGMVIKGSLKGKQAAVGLAQTMKDGAIIGLQYDTFAKNENQDNITGTLKKHYPWLDTPLATGETDGPLMRKFKHIVEGMGIGAVFDATLFKMLPVASLLGKKGIAAGKAGIDAAAPVVKETATTVADAGVKLGGKLGKAGKEIGEDLRAFRDDMVATDPAELNVVGQKVRDVLDTDLDDLRSRFAEYTQSRRDSVEAQKREEVAEQLKQPGVRFPKNEPIGDRTLGNSTSNHSAADVDKGIKAKKENWGSEDGHVGSMTSNTLIEKLAVGTDTAVDTMKKIMGNFRTQKYVTQLEATAKEQGKKLQDVVAENLTIFREIYEGRATSEISDKEFFERITRDRTQLKAAFKDPKTGKIRRETVGEYVRPEYIKALDMVNISLFNDIQALGVTGRELADITDITDIDGPAQQLVKKLIAGLKLRKEASAEVSQQLSDFGLGRIKDVKRGRQVSGDFKTYAQFKKAVAASKQAAREANEKAVQQSIDAFRMALDLSAEEGGDDLFKILFEGISMADGVHTLDDLDVFMRKKMRGGTFKGDKKMTGAFLREFGTMFTHSVLSGPKTPIRAIMGTGSATFSRPMAMAIGGAMGGDMVTSRAGLASLNALVQTIPESFEFFKKRLNSYWAGDLSTIKTRYIERNTLDDQWQFYGHWAETRGNTTDKILYRTANMIRGLNDSSLLTYSTKIMAATDDAFQLMIGRARAREKAFLAAADKMGDSNFANFDAKFFRDMEDNFNKEIFDENGMVTDAMAEYSRQEATLTAPLTGFGKNLSKAFDDAPWARPFFLFARTGINGLQLTAKHTPGFNFLVDEFNMIAKAKVPTPELQQFGIHTQQDLINAKAIQNGRLAMGTAALSMASMAYLSGNLHGNGPTDRKQRQAWMDMGWKPRTIKIGDVWVNYDAFEPYNQILALVGDIGDHQELMGEEWAEDSLLKLSMALANTASSKSYLAGMQSFVDLFSGKPGQQNRIIASLMNNTVPLSGLRNEIGKVLTPYTRELGSDIQSAIRNRNLLTENIASDPLPIKYDILTGKPIKDHDFVTRMFNAVSPVNFNLDYSEGREFLFNSGYDMRTSTYTAPDGTDLSDSPKVRSMFQKAIGDQNLLAKFDAMAKEESIAVSMAEMNWHKRNGMKDVEPKSFPHYKRIAKTFDRAKKRAWASLKNDNDVQKLLLEERNQKLKNVKANRGTIDKILEMPK